MTIAMTPHERETFLAGVHVGVLSVDDPGHAPLSVPVWYAYEPGSTLDVITDRDSVKAHRLRAAGRFSLCAQTEVAPYGYVSVEGPITDVVDPADPEWHRALAYRYLGPEFAELYLAATKDDAPNSVMFRLAPERWRTADFTKQYG
jgi:nitroimidazol reductase NimA-like FMN-containing flavoprotein (pyridoxamine 5'-phosphate oxidase superfamily)